MLADNLTPVPITIFEAVTLQGIEVVHPPVGWHDHTTALAAVGTDQTEREGDIQLIRIVPLSDKDIAGKLAVILEGAGKSGPEATPCYHLPIISTTIMVGTDIGSSGHIRLPHNQTGDKKRVVVVLLMATEDKVVENFTATYRGVVP